MMPRIVRLTLVSIIAAAAVASSVACLRTVPTPMAAVQELPLVAFEPGLGELDTIPLGPEGRFAMVGEFSISPETMGVDIGALMGEDATSLQSGTVWCVEPVTRIGDSLVLSVGMTWWPPGAEPNYPSRSITEGLQRCLGFLESKAWSRATVYLAAGRVPRVEPATTRPPIQEGTQTLEVALEQAFLFGVAAPFQARGLALGTATQDGQWVDEDRGMQRKAEAHITRDGNMWNVSNRITYTATKAAGKFSLLGATTVDTVLDGTSYVMAHGMVNELVPREVTRAALRLRAGLQREFISMTARTRATYSPGLSCVLRTLSPPGARMFYGEMSRPGTGDDSEEAEALARSIDGGVVVEKKFAGVDLEAAQRCTLSDEDQEGPRRSMR
jgi:hypothetical protein